MEADNEITNVLNKLGLTESEAAVLFKHFFKKYLTEECYLEVGFAGHNVQENNGNYGDLEITVSLNAQGDNVLYDSATTTILVGKY